MKYWLITYIKPAGCIREYDNPTTVSEVFSGEWINFVSSRYIKTIIFLKEITEEEYQRF